MIAQEPSDLKEDPRDFALWKATKAHEDTEWDSPWGPGRPGWHIECSAMAEKHLGPEFEIHGGGLDLRFPHHENELAQSRGAGRPFARFWAHNGMLQLSEEKMSKSVGNIVSLREVLDTYGREAILVFFLSGHYRSPLDYSDEAMEAATVSGRGLPQRFPRGRVAARTFPAGMPSSRRSTTTSTRPRRLRSCTPGGPPGGLDLLARALAVFGLASVAEQEEAPREVVDLADARKEAREAGRLRRGRQAAERSRSARVGGAGQARRLRPRRQL